MRRLILIPMLIIVVLMAGCGADGTKDVSIGANSDKNATVGNSSTIEKETKNEEGQQEVMKEDASFEGQIDSNSIEVSTESQTFALQIGNVKDVEWKSIEKNNPISIEYYKNESGQYVLTSINIAPVNKMRAIIEEAIFVGQIDANSIEVIINSEALALQIGGVAGVDWSSINKNSLVIVDYYENEKGQNMLQSIIIK